MKKSLKDVQLLEELSSETESFLIEMLLTAYCSKQFQFVVYPVILPYRLVPRRIFVRGIYELWRIRSITFHQTSYFFKVVYTKYRYNTLVDVKNLIDQRLCS